MKYRLCAALAVALLVAAALPAGAATTASGSIAAVTAPQPLSLDPALGDPAWKTGAVAIAGGFQDLTTHGPAPHATDVSVLYDAHNLYVAFRAEQAGTPITATATTNDVGFGSDDFVGIGIDPSGNATQAYFFETTPRGVRYEQANENARYQPVWQSAARIDGTTWTAIMVIPLNVLRIHAGSPQTWRINFIRNVAASGERYSWAYDGLMSDGPPGAGWPFFADARFWPRWTGVRIAASLASVRPQPRLELYGLDSSGRDRSQFAQADGAFLPQGARVAGADLTYPVTNTINFVGTLNPDFSNVEIDQQTIAPQEFRRGLQEYRPFFSQGAAFINATSAPVGGFFTPINQVFYSPSVGPFDRGEKIEGTFGMQSFGALAFSGYDRTANQSFDDLAYGYKHATPDRTFLYWGDGVLARHSLAGTDATNEYGIAGRNLKTGLVWAYDGAFENGSALASSTPVATAQSTNAFIDVHKPNWEVYNGYTNITPFYNPVDGFTVNSDIRGLTTSFNFNGSTPGIKNFFFFFAADRYFDRSGAVHQADLQPSLALTLKNGFSLDNVGPLTGELRSYAIDPNATNCNDPNLQRSAFSGFPAYRCGRTDTFNLMQIPIGFRDGTATPVDVALSYGRFGGSYLHLYNSTFSRPIGHHLTIGLEYDGSFERSLATGAFDSQWLRRISLGASLDAYTNVTLGLRTINGNGGFSSPGSNLAWSLHRRFTNGDELFMNFGTPASTTTLDRFIVKYLFRFGGQAGT